MTELILASTSPYRRELLERLGWNFTAMAPAFDEDRAKDEAPTESIAHAAFLARGKALSLASAGRIVIGGDQLVSFHGYILGKPKTFEKACEQLGSMSGQTHEIHTAVCVNFAGQTREWVQTSRLTLRELSRQQIENYVRMDQPLDCAGSYKFEKHGVLLFEKVECDDFTGIQGLPLLKLAETLVSFGLVPFQTAAGVAK